jgi:hypothetical protein
MRRVMMGVAALAMMAVPVGVATVTLAPAANAGSSITCGKLSGTITGTITIKKCSPKNKSYKSLSGTATLLAGGGALTWAPGGQTTIVSAPSTSSPGQGACKTGNTEYISTGTVTGGTSTYTHVGDTFHSETCVTTKNSKISLLKGSVLSF